MFEITLPTLAPIFLIIALGWWLHTRRILPEGFFSGLNTLTFYIGLPALLLVGIATAPLAAGPVLRMFYVLVAATAGVTLLAYPLARLFKLEPPSAASFVQAAMRGNIAYIGLPLVFYAMDGMPVTPDAPGVRAAAMLVLANAVPLYNIASIVILEHGSGAAGTRPSVGSVTCKVVSNPLLIACLLGLMLALTGIGLPTLLDRTLRPLGQMALPLALLSMGATFTRSGERRPLPGVLAAAILKVGAAPLLGLFLCRGFGLSPLETLVILIFLACPTAITSYVMADKMGCDSVMARDAVVVSTLLALFPLAAILTLCAR